MLDRLIASISPRLAYEREAYRQGVDALRGQRTYAAAARGRLTNDWRAGQDSADAALMGDLGLLRARHRQMVRDNPLMAAIRRNLITGLVGDGITLRAVHPDPAVRKRAQQRWDAFMGRLVDGRHDGYGIQRLVIGALIDGGEALVVWRPWRGRPDQQVTVLEGDYLDHTLNQSLADGGRIVMGVEYDRAGQRVAYHLFEEHPGDLIVSRARQRRRVEARDVDHVFEPLRPGQTRGVPWFHAALPTAREIQEVKAAVRIKKRVEACLSLFRRPAEGGAEAVLGEREKKARGPDFETLRPGMILTGAPGEEAPTVINPSSSGDGDGFLRGEAMAACAAAGIPYHLGTGDVSQANYSSIRTDMVAYYARLDDWTYHTLDPHLLAPMFRRVMRVGALEDGDDALLQVGSETLPPPREWVDPLKDITAKILEARAIPGAMHRLLAEYGTDPDTAAQLQKDWNDLLDRHGLALDSDPRRVNGSGGLQPAAGYLAPRGGDSDRMLEALAARLLASD